MCFPPPLFQGLPPRRTCLSLPRCPNALLIRRFYASLSRSPCNFPTIIPGPPSNCFNISLSRRLCAYFPLSLCASLPHCPNASLLRPCIFPHRYPCASFFHCPNASLSPCRSCDPIPHSRATCARLQRYTCAFFFHCPDASLPHCPNASFPNCPNAPLPRCRNDSLNPCPFASLSHCPSVCLPHFSCASLPRFPCLCFPFFSNLSLLRCHHCP